MPWRAGTRPDTTKLVVRAGDHASAGANMGLPYPKKYPAGFRGKGPGGAGCRHRATLAPDSPYQRQANCTPMEFCDM